MRITKVLVISNKNRDLKHLGKLLTKKGYAPVFCQETSSASSCLEDNRFPITLVDITMQDKEDCIGLVRTIRDKNPFGAIVPICTKEDMDLALLCIGYEICDVLLKPIWEERLYETLDRAKAWFFMRLNLRLKIRWLERLVDNRTRKILEAGDASAIRGQSKEFMHSILDPLTVILGRAELMKSELENLSLSSAKNDGENGHLNSEMITRISSSINQGIDRIYQNSQRIFQVVDSILLHSVEDKKKRTGEIDINDLILREIEIYKSDVFFKHRVKKFYYMDPFLDRIDFEYKTIRRIIDNLIENAISAMQGSLTRQITIATCQDEDNIYISLHHTGKKAQEDAVHDKGNLCNYNDDEILKTCREMIMPYYGDIDFEHKMGVGTTFRIVLPRPVNTINSEEGIWQTFSNDQKVRLFNKELTGLKGLLSAKESK